MKAIARTRAQTPDNLRSLDPVAREPGAPNCVGPREDDRWSERLDSEEAVFMVAKDISICHPGPVLGRPPRRADVADPWRPMTLFLNLYTFLPVGESPPNPSIGAPW